MASPSHVTAPYPRHKGQALKCCPLSPERGLVGVHGDQAEDPGSWPLGLLAVLGPEPPHPAVSPNSNQPAGSQGRAGFRSGLLDTLVTYQNIQGRGLDTTQTGV